MKILNIKDVGNKESISNNYHKFFEQNAKENGGNLYLQSKFYRAKERLDLEKNF